VPQAGSGLDYTFFVGTPPNDLAGICALPLERARERRIYGTASR
jgi:hypothetical protein